MTGSLLHRWDLAPQEAIALQESLRHRVVLASMARAPQTIAGADIAIDTVGNEGIAGVVVYRYPDLQEVERQSARRRIDFPYIPGLLAFREIPILLEAFSRFQVLPELVLVDGQGIAHPRGFGIASHLGLWLERPTIGCAKSRLVGEYDEPSPSAGSRTPLRLHGRVVGAVLRTRDRVQPIFVSPGHLIDLEGAVRVVRTCCDGLRIPKPTREADRYVGEVKIGRAPHAPDTQPTFGF